MAIPGFSPKQLLERGQKYYNYLGGLSEGYLTKVTDQIDIFGGHLRKMVNLLEKFLEHIKKLADSYDNDTSNEKMLY